MTTTMVWGCSMKITINNEEVLCNKDFTIQEEMLNTSSVILNNVYPRTWEQDKDYVSRFYYPPDYSKCKIFNEIYHPEEKSTASGTNFTLNNVDLDKQYYIEDLKGQTTQSGTPTPTSPVPINTTTGRQEVVVCGKNLFSGYNFSKTTNGITYTYNNDGTILVNGTSTGNAYSMLSSDATSFYKTLEAGTYTLSGGIANVNLQLIDSGGTALANTTSHQTFTITEQKRYYIRLYISSGKTFNNQTINVMLEKNNQATTYEEYKGNTYEINLGKQLWQLRDRTVSTAGITAVVENGTITLNGTATAIAFCEILLDNTVNWENGKTYTISAFNPVLNNGVRIRTASTGANDITLTTINRVYSITHSSNVSRWNDRFTIRVENGTTLDNYTITPMLEKGSVATSYAPYKTPIELCKIGNYQDKIYKQNGNWYIYKEIGKYTFTGSENWSLSSYGTNSWDNNDIISTTHNTNELLIISNIFKGIAHKDRGTSGNNIIYTYGNSNFEVRNTSYTSQTDIRNATKGNYIYWVMRTPTTTLIEDEELINELESIRLLSGLNNVSLSSPNLPFIMDLVYNYVSAYTEEDMLFCGVVENTGNISLNPREPHYCNLQVLDFKTFLSEGETLDFVIYEKTILEAIDQVISVIAPYGFIKGNVNILHGDDVIGAYSTKNKTAYDVFNYIADITQSRWTTRMIDEDTIAIDFYDPTLMPQGTAIEYNNTWFCNNNILDMSFSYSSRDYRNKQVMLSGEVFANIETTEVITADGYQTQFNTTDKIGYVSSIAVNGTPATIITKDEYELGYEGDFIYQPGNPYFESENLVSTGSIITIVYYAVIEGREVLLNQVEVEKINTMTNRKGVIARYETRNDATTTQELNQIGQSYLKYKGSPEVSLKVSSINNIWNIGERVEFTAPLDELTTEYMVKKKTINYITTQENIFYTYELSSSFNSETEINYFDNQRAKTMGNIGVGEFISRNIDIENTANIIFYDLEVNEVQISGDSTLQSELQAPLGVE